MVWFKLKMWQIKYKKSFEKDLRKLPKQIIQRVVKKIDQLQQEGQAPGVIKLVGYDNFYRARIGDYRLVYERRETDIVLVMIAAGHRKEIYRKLKL